MDEMISTSKMITELFFSRQSPLSATSERLSAIEVLLGGRFPQAFIEFCSRWNGGFPETNNSFYPVPREFGEFHKEYGPTGRGITVDGLFGVTDDFPQCSLLREYDNLAKISSIGIIPIAFELLGNHVVLRKDATNGPVFWRDHELWEAPEHPHLIPIADNLEVFYNSLTTNPFEDK